MAHPIRHFETDRKAALTHNAITVRQPWAALIMRGAKRFETRSWPAPMRLIGNRLAIHAGAAAIGPNIPNDAIPAIEAGLGLSRPSWVELPFGAVVAIVRVTGAYQIDAAGVVDGQLRFRRTIAGSVPLDGVTLMPGEKHFGDFEPGHWLWRLEEVEVVTPPVKVGGRQGVWSWEPEVR